MSMHAPFDCKRRRGKLAPVFHEQKDNNTKSPSRGEACWPSKQRITWDTKGQWSCQQSRALQSIACFGSLLTPPSPTTNANSLQHSTGTLPSTNYLTVYQEKFRTHFCDFRLKARNRGSSLGGSADSVEDAERNTQEAHEFVRTSKGKQREGKVEDKA